MRIVKKKKKEKEFILWWYQYLQAPERGKKKNPKRRLILKIGEERKKFKRNMGESCDSEAKGCFVWNASEVLEDNCWKEAIR